jgi:hypothetical protein
MFKYLMLNIGIWLLIAVKHVLCAAKALLRMTMALHTIFWQLKWYIKQRRNINVPNCNRKNIDCPFRKGGMAVLFTIIDKVV